jgi:hypothetical protein
MNGRHEQCRLCHTEGELRLSHIFPEFLYKPLYDEKHRMVGLQPIQSAKDDVLQKGLREYMLCASCEQHLSRYEKYASEVLMHLPNTESDSPGTVVRIKDINYAKFKVFQLSLLWRAGVARHASFQEVNLGPHEESLRRMILDGYPGEPLEYGCVLIRTQGPEPLNKIIKMPGHFRFVEHHAYHMLLSGMIWIYIVSSHSGHIHEKRSFLSEAGVLPIHIASETAKKFIAGLGKELRRMGVIT